MIIPNNKAILIKEIHAMTGYTHKVINDIYLLPQRIEPRRSKYYAKLAWLKRLQGFYASLKRAS